MCQQLSVAKILSHIDDNLATESELRINQHKIFSKFDQEIPQSQTVDNPMAPQGRATQKS